MNYQCKAFRNGTEVDGRYANSLNVSHNSFEFVLNAGHFYPQNEHTQLHTRIVTSPTHAKAMLEILKESIEQYEQEFGAIKSAQ
jgi:hypothetical protein